MGLELLMFLVNLSIRQPYKIQFENSLELNLVNILRIGFFVYEYPPAIVGGLGFHLAQSCRRDTKNLQITNMKKFKKAI